MSFTEPVEIDSLSQGLQLSYGSVSVDGTVNLLSNGRIVRFTPSMPLEAIEEYRIILKGIKALNGKELNLPDDGVISVFRTGAGKVKAGDGASGYIN